MHSKKKTGALTALEFEAMMQEFDYALEDGSKAALKVR